MGQSRAPMCPRCAGRLCPVCGIEPLKHHNATSCKNCKPKCEQCGCYVSAGRKICPRCETGSHKCPECGWTMRGGVCRNKHTTTKPHQTAAWRRRRLEVIARTRHCEWCAAVFAPPKNPAVVHHLVETYSLPDGSPDWDRYYAMADDEVAVICKGCHHLWTTLRVRPDDPRIRCPACAGFKNPRFELCFSCHQKRWIAKRDHCWWPNPFRFPTPPWRFAGAVADGLPARISPLNETDFRLDPGAASTRASWMRTWRGRRGLRR